MATKNFKKILIIVVIVSAIAGIVLGIVSEMLGWGIMHN